MSKKLYFGTNLKMYKNIAQTTSYLRSLEACTQDLNRDEMELFVIPSFTSLSSAVSCVDPAYITLGAQNMCWEEEGQYTGEISPLMIQEMGLKMVMIGHAERRYQFGENDIIANKKVKCAAEHQLTALLCVGETEEERNFGISDEMIRMQVKVGLHGIEEKQLEHIWISYDPAWAIGASGTPASSDYAEARIKNIKKCLAEMFGDAAEEIPVLYGGGVSAQIANDLILQPSIDGLFIGRSAWDEEDFSKIIHNAKSAYDNRFDTGL